MIDRPTQSSSKQTAESDKSYFSEPPTVSLPKDGGRLRKCVRNWPLAQAKNYTVAYDVPLGLLINFGGKSLEHKLLFNHR